MKNRCSGMLALALCVGATIGLPAMAQESKPADAKQAEAKQAAPKLAIGDRAPKIEVEKFVKGDAITGFERGKVYVVEFWATWCGPCIKAFPHLTELQKQYKDKVTFVGVNVWEDREYTDETLKGVEEFVQKQGDKMGYTVAYDGKAGKMDKTYMKAAGQNGIPAAFIVDGEGRIAWIGHPMGLDPVLEEVASGKWNIDKARADAKKAEEEEAKRVEAMAKAQPIIERIRTAMGEENWDAAAKAMDDLYNLDPEQFAGIQAQKFMMYLNEAKQPAKAYGLKDALLANKTIMGNAQMLNRIAWGVVDPQADVETRDADFALAFAQKANELTNASDPAIIDTVARCHWLKGDKAKAIELQQKAVKLCEENEDYAEMKEDLAATLAEYKSKM